MLFWLITGAMTVLALALLVSPLLRAQARPQGRAAFDVAVYQARIKELERDLERGLISPDEAAAARVEIDRRLLAAHDPREAVAPSSGRKGALSRRGAKAVAAGLVLVLPALAVGLYLYLGSPGAPGRPHAALAPAVPDQRMAGLQHMVEQLELVLEARPDDAKTLLQLGRVLFAMERYEESVSVYTRLVETGEGPPEAPALLGEALVFAAEGYVTGAARAAFAQAPRVPRARFYIALGDYQAGRPQSALEAWAALAREAPAGAPFLAPLEARIRGVAAELGENPEDYLAERSAAAEPPAGIPAEQQQLVESMVAGLAARLEESPDDLEGWRRLGRSYIVLGRPADAAEAYRRARELAPESAEVHAAYGVALIQASPAGSPIPLEAKAAIERALELDPDSVDALWFAG
ncbi:MAG: c-type cytochrome biogenesis protein CcmI, partial [Alphaproteobacteria bacterium]